MGSLDERFRDLPPPARFPPEAVIRCLDGDLVLRRATPDDTEALTAFHAVGLADAPDYEPNPYLQEWTPELMGGRHPTMRAGEFILVEDTARRRVASTMCLIPQPLSYGGVELDAGQPELVATHPDYRRRGLVRLQLEVLHRLGEERGHALQLIDGIPWYYRQFGYEMAIELGAGRRLPARELPRDRPDVGLSVRAAEESDIPFLIRLYEGSRERSRLFCVRGEAQWRYELRERAPLSYGRREIRVVETEDAEPVAAFAHYPVLVMGGELRVQFLEAAPGTPWTRVVPAVLWSLRSAGEALDRRSLGGPFVTAAIQLGRGHPAYAAVRGETAPGYAYYARVPRLCGLLARVTPVLERHLRDSPLAGYTGALEISLYRTGVRLELRDGRIGAVEPWQPSTETPGQVAFPDLTFLKLLFGYRSLAELRGAFPDCIASESAAALVDALFPRRPSNLWLVA